MYTTMKILEPKCELWFQGNTEQEAIEHVCKCAQVAYQSEPKTGDNAKNFYRGLIKSGHLSCLRHRSYYFIVRNIDILDNLDVIYCLQEYLDGENPYINILVDSNNDYDTYYIATNGQWILEHNAIYIAIEQFQVTPKEFEKSKYGKSLMRYTFSITTQISTTRELLRHSPQSCTELSTRYIKIGGNIEPTIVRPSWLPKEHINSYNDVENKQRYYEQYTDWETSELGIISNYLIGCDASFSTYNTMLELGAKPEEARGVLPLDTMSKIVMTHTIEEWKHIINMRYYGTAGKPHPNIKIIIGMVRDELIKLGYE